jgi:oligopeptide transport system substrate-binding protein
VSGRALAALLAGALCVLSGCGSAQRSSTVAAADTIRVGSGLAASQVLARALDDEPRSLDPQLADDVPSQRVVDDLFEGLTAVDMDGRPVPGIASSWQISPDGLTWLFHLRPKARWSNGVPLTAQDFVYSWRRIVSPSTGAPYAQALAPIEHALDIASGKAAPDTLGVEAVDAHTLRVKLTGPTPYLLDLLAQQYLYPVYEPAIERYGEDWIRPGHMVCDGAFTLREHVIGNRITLMRNPNYWDAAQVRLQQVIYYEMTDRSVQAQRFMAGGVQWTDAFDSSQLQWLRSRLGQQVVTSPYFGTFMLGFNFDMPPFRGNRRLREALVLAIDREALIHYMLPGYEPAYTLVPPLPGYRQPVPEWAELSESQRHALAVQLYHQAGYSDAHPLHVQLDMPVQGAEERHFFEAIAASWHAVLGADVQLQEQEFKVLLQNLSLHKSPLFHDSWIGDYPDPNTFMQTFHTNDGNNYTAYSNPQFDHLVDAAAREKDQAQRYHLFEQAETLLNADAAYVPLYYYATRHLIKPYLRGWRLNIMDRNLSRYMYLLEHQGE